jgi:site-specific DNA-cytosine methylase
MKVLVACERSGIVREAFRALGHDAWSCDLEPAEDGGHHFTGDALQVASGWSGVQWDMMIAHPPCQYLSVSGLHWNKRRRVRSELTEAAVEFALALWNLPIPYVALENPVGILSSRIRKPDQIIQPYEFGEDASKRTCLWLRGLPRLKGTKRVPGRLVIRPDGKEFERWANQTDSGQNRLGPSPTRSMDRARTYRGVAEAMANQWGST